MNDSNVSSISIIGSPAQKQQRQQKPKSPARKKVAKSGKHWVTPVWGQGIPHTVYLYY